MTARGTTIAAAISLLGILLTVGAASAQFGRQQDNLGLAASWAYSGDDTGFRLELGQRDFVVSGGYFNADDYGARGDGKAYALELGVAPSMFMDDYEGMPFVLGVGGYRFTADAPDIGDDDSFSFWLGAGDFEHSQKGLFYQYRYIFDGPIGGSQGIVGWAF
ncbi:MAG: hypothetical protein ACOCX2_14315 [Armatimonadota bacterium]